MSLTSIVVPTLGKSPWLEECLRALRGEDEQLEILVVAQATDLSDDLRALADRVLEFEQPLGFAAANNRAFAVARGEFLATVNDDAVIEPGWLSRLLGVLREQPHVAAVQGVNLSMDDPPRVDGRGIAWNSWLQAVQIDHGRLLSELEAPEFEEIFGVSATAAVYRRSALEAVAFADDDGESSLARVFDETLESYYEDVDLAVRLRRDGRRAFCVAEARARHAGSWTGGSEGSRPLIYGNRYAVLRRRFGASFWLSLPWIFTRDVLDVVRGDRQTAQGIFTGWRRAIRLLSSPNSLKGRP